MKETAVGNNLHINQWRIQMPRSGLAEE